MLTLSSGRRILRDRRTLRASLAASVLAFGFSPLQGSGEVTAIAIEYRGPSNEFLPPILLMSRGRTCAEMERVLRAWNVMLAPSQCPIEVTSLELAALRRGLLASRVDSSGGLDLQPRLLRATIEETDRSVREVWISYENAGRALDVVASHIPQDRDAALSTRLSEMRQRLAAPALVSLPRLSCGVQAAGIDDAVHNRIINDLMEVPPTWSVGLRTSSNTAANRLLELTADGKRVWVGISYLASRDDAALNLRCRLIVIPVLRHRSVAGIGDEAFVLTESVLLFRFGTLVFHVQSFDQLLDSEKAIAIRLIASIQRSQSGDTARSPAIQH